MSDFFGAVYVYFVVTLAVVALVLNSVGNLERSFCYLDGYGKINCYLDNDEAGRKTFEALHTRYAEKTVDCSSVLAFR